MTPVIQEVKPRPLSGWKGAALVLGIVAFLCALAMGLSALQEIIGYAAASLSLWGVGIALGLWGMRRFVMGYRYVLDGEELRVSHLYGKRVRFLDCVLLRSAVACGTPEEMRLRFPNARVVRAVKKDCALAVMAVAFRAEDVKILCLQPSDDLRAAIVRAVKAH